MTMFRIKRHYRLRLLKKTTSSPEVVFSYRSKAVKSTDIKQDTRDWHNTRMKMPTASEFDKIITYGGKASDQQLSYMYQLVYQRIFGQYAREIKPSFWMERGKRLEKEAFEVLNQHFRGRVMPGGYWITDDGKAGCSPDGVLTGNEEAVEIKVPEPWRHIMYTVEGPLKDYKAQIQGVMYVGGFKRVHFFSYCPGMPHAIHTIERDEPYIEELDKLIQVFVGQLEIKEKLARMLGNYGKLVIDEQNNTVERVTRE